MPKNVKRESRGNTGESSRNLSGCLNLCEESEQRECRFFFLPNEVSEGGSGPPTGQQVPNSNNSNNNNDGHLLRITGAAVVGG